MFSLRIIKMVYAQVLIIVGNHGMVLLTFNTLANSVTCEAWTTATISSATCRVVSPCGMIRRPLRIIAATTHSFGMDNSLNCRPTATEEGWTFSSTTEYSPL